MNVQDLAAKATARCGIRIEPHDPAFVLVALNEIILEETTRTICSQMEKTVAMFVEKIQVIEEVAGQRLAVQVRSSGTEIRAAIQNDLRQARWKTQELVLQVSRKTSRPAFIRWLAIGLLSAIMFFFAGVYFGAYVPFSQIISAR
jgi:hypothetical protein